MTAGHDATHDIRYTMNPDADRNLAARLAIAVLSEMEPQFRKYPGVNQDLCRRAREAVRIWHESFQNE